MRTFSALPIVALLLTGMGVQARAQTSCTGTATTSVSGVVYAPNGTDPLPNVTVYIPNASVDPFTPGVSCPMVGALPSGVVLGVTPAAVGTITAVDGSFTILNAPVGQNIPLVAVSGRWRVQSTVNTTACATTVMNLSMPQSQLQGDIPKIAIATGAVDQVECILRKMGISNSEFTNPSGSGRINFFMGSTSSGAVIDAATPTQGSLMGGDGSTLNKYDVLMLPCQGNPVGGVESGASGAQELANFINFANLGGRVYASHYSYAWMYNNPPFDGVANWTVNDGSYADGTATVNTNFTAGQTLATWLQEVAASTTPGQIAIKNLKHDLNGVIPPTQSWLTLNDAATGNPVMQLVFNTPIATAANLTPNQCGRVLFNEYHVEGGNSSAGNYFPSECAPGTAMTPQEKLLEYMLFELTNDSGQPALTPATQDFGSEAVGYPTAAKTFTWTNNSSFPLLVSTATISGADFSIVTDGCSGTTVDGEASCTITVVFTPSSLGAQTGMLTVLSGGFSQTASLTGTGTPGFSLYGSPLTFGNVDVGASATQTLTLTSLASVPLTVPAFVTTGSYTVSTAACGTTLAAGASCPVSVTFQPTVTGPLNGTLGVNSTSLLYSGLNATMTGNGVDFTIFLNPTSGTVIAGDGTTTTATLTPIAGFSALLTVSCTVASGATASSCSLNPTTVTPSTAVTALVSMATTSQYTVIGYGGFGGCSWLWLVSAASGWMLWRRRRSGRVLLRGGLLALLLGAMSLSLSGCTGKLPAQNVAWTGAGNYSVTVTATDGFLIRSAT